MGNDLGAIELSLIVREKGLKESLTLTQRLERDITRATKALEENRMSQERYNKVLLQAKREYQTLGVSSQKATSEIRRFAAESRAAMSATTSQTAAIERQTVALQKNAAAANQTKRGTNQLGVLMQQTGYQVGDFAIQVQSGTNYMVAFGQQATQLIGTFAMLAKSTRMIALFSGLGIAVPILTAIGAYFVRAAENAENTTEKVKSFSDALSDSQSAIDRSKASMQALGSEGLDTLRERYGELTTEVSELAEALAEIDRKAKVLEVQKTMNTLFSPEFFKQVTAELGNIGAAIVETTDEDIKYMQEEVKALQDQFDAGLMPPESVETFKAMKEELALVKGDLENAGDLANELKVPADSLQTFKDLEESIKKATAEGNFLAAANGISEMRALMKSLGIEVDQGALANMTRLEDILRQAVASISDATDETNRLEAAANAVATAFSQMAGFSLSLKDKVAAAAAQLEALNAGQDKAIAGEIALLRVKNERLGATEGMADGAARAMQEEYQQNLVLIDTLEKTKKAIKEKEAATKSSARSTKKSLDDQLKAAEKLRKELEGPMVSAVGSVADAFGNFIARGLTDFKGFVQQILGSFQNMIAQMIAMAVKNRIMLSLGIGGITPAAAAAGQVAGLGGAAFSGPVGSFIGSFGAAGAAGTGLLGGFGAAMPSFLGGAGNGLFAVGANAAAAGGTFAATLGAIAAPLLAVTAIFSFFKKKVKELDSGLQATVTTLDATIQSFRTIETKRFWGLSKKVTTEITQLSKEASDPIVESIVNIQNSVMEAASAFGISSDVFDNFIYNLKISLKGLSEDQQTQKIAEELTKMGDAFASLTGHFETMNELLEAANERYQIQNRILQAQNAQAELLARQREAEMASVHDLNKSLLQAAFNLEDARAAMDASLRAIQVSVQQQAAQIQKDAQDKIQQLNDGAAAQIESIRNNSEAQIEALQSSIEGVVSGFETSLEGAEEALSRSSDIFDALSDTLNSRLSTTLTDQQFSVRRSQAFGFLSSIEDLRSVDTERLERALDTVSEPSEDLFSNFVDYARDFKRTTSIISELTDKAGGQLSADQQMVDLLEQQLDQAKDSNASQIEAIRDLAEKQIEAIQNALSSQVDGIQSSSESQISALQAQYDIALKQYNAALGIDDSVKSVGAAINDLTKAIQDFMLASKQAELESAGTQFVSKTSGQIVLNNEEELLKLAGVANIATTGKTGQEIVKQIADYYGKSVTGTVVSDDNIWNKQFAMGGYHTGGVRMVGERGPELEATGPSRIFSHNQTASMFRDPDLREAVRSLKEEVSGLRSEQRQIQMDISKYTKRSYDIERKWDTEGLPATRT